MLQTIPGYKIQSKLGTGGMSSVFLAVDLNTKRKVAIKILYPSKAKDKLILNRFLKESSLLLQLSHPHIVKGIAYKSYLGINFFVMDYLDGQSLQELINRQKIILDPDALKITLQTADALQYLHSKGYIHRDLKPANIFIEQPGIYVKLLDLGLASKLGGPARTGVTSGTPEFMSPEQAQGLKQDVRSDIYSLGIILYYMVSGELPFKGNEPREVMAAQVKQRINSMKLKTRAVSETTHYFIERMVSKEKNLRYESVADLIQDMKTRITETEKMKIMPQQKETSIMKGLKQIRRRF